MSTWNYRVGFKTTKTKVDLSNDYYENVEYGIVECYYDEDGEILFTSEEFQHPYGETYEELISDMQLMYKDAQDRSPIDLDKLWKELAESKDNMWNELKDSIELKGEDGGN